MRPEGVRIYSSIFLRRSMLTRFSRPAVKAYGELPENAKINETDTYARGDDDNECNFEFDEDRDSEDSDSGAAGGQGKEIEIDDI